MTPNQKAMLKYETIRFKTKHSIESFISAVEWFLLILLSDGRKSTSKKLIHFEKFTAENVQNKYFIFLDDGYSYSCMYSPFDY